MSWQRTSTRLKRCSFYCFFYEVVLFQCYSELGCVISTSHYLTSILHQDTFDMWPMYMRLICMSFTPYVSWCTINVVYYDIEKSFLILSYMLFVSWWVGFKFHYLWIFGFKFPVICTHNIENYFIFVESMVLYIKHFLSLLYCSFTSLCYMHFANAFH